VPDWAGPWFTLEIYGWKCLGDTGEFPAPGCLGVCIGAVDGPPAMGALAKETALVILNLAPVASFGR
jgi:hypothetical protein